MRVPLACACLAALALAGCAAPDERPPATVLATARATAEGAWDVDLAIAAVETLGYEASHAGTHGFMTHARDGHTLFLGSPDADAGTLQASVSFRLDDADVCATRTYDEWVDALLARLAPLAAERMAALEAASGWRVGEPQWEVTASGPEGDLLRFPEHCGTTVACVGADPCEPRSRWQDGRPD